MTVIRGVHSAKKRQLLIVIVISGAYSGFQNRGHESSGQRPRGGGTWGRNYGELSCPLTRIFFLNFIIRNVASRENIGDRVYRPMFAEFMGADSLPLSKYAPIVISANFNAYNIAF